MKIPLIFLTIFFGFCVSFFNTFYLALNYILILNQNANITNHIINGVEAFSNATFSLRIVSAVTGAQIGGLFSGTAITPTRAVTVGQAVFEYNIWRIGSGSLNVSLLTTQESRTAYVHPGFNPNNLANNVAIIYMDQPVGSCKFFY